MQPEIEQRYCEKMGNVVFLIAVWCIVHICRMLLVSYRLLSKLTNKAISNSEILLI